MVPEGITTDMGYSSLRDLVMGQATGINFGGLSFSEPTLLNKCFPPAQAGLYAILILDVRFGPRPYRSIYFGQAEDLSERVNASHEKYPCWRGKAGAAGLYASFCPLYSSTKLARQVLEANLIKQYQPACNVQGR